MAENTCAVHAGRLLEVRADRGYCSLDDVETMRARLARTFDALPPDSKVVIAADWRRTQLMDGEAAQAASAMIATFNHRVERSGILVADESPLCVLQFLHFVRETHHPQRRIFCFEDELSAWLSDLLTGEERVRLGEFLLRR
jgi:hypothetical protein